MSPPPPGVLAAGLDGWRFGDRLDDIAAGMARLGDGTTPASIVGAMLDRLVAELAKGETPEAPDAA